MSITLQSVREISDDVGSDDEEGSADSEYQQILLQQSVTMLAYMDRTTQNSTVTAGISRPQMLLGFSAHDLPILIGAGVGAAGLIIIILVAFIVWRCCRLRSTLDKAYCLDNSIPDDTYSKHNGGNIMHSDSVVFVGVKNKQVATYAIPSKPDLLQSSLVRSLSATFQDPKNFAVTIENEKKAPKKRPNSQPVPMSSLFSSKRAQSQCYRNVTNNNNNYECPSGLPSIPEVLLKSSENLPHSLYASCNALDGQYAYSSLYSTLDSNTTMKTRSLPSWGRSHPRPLSTEDDLGELYAKVSFSKKRKNRMRSDSAAAIAANKSKGNYMTLTYTHKDTDSLVDNEAVVVYDERTAL